MKRHEFLKRINRSRSSHRVPRHHSFFGARGDGAIAPSEKIVMAFIGAGSQGGGHVRAFSQQPDVRGVAICDVREAARTRNRDIVNNANNDKNVTTYDDYRELLARKDIDAVPIATPEHWHTTISIEAARQGKNVYREKPIGVSIGGAKALRDAVKRYGIVFQEGCRQRSRQGYRHTCELIRNGRIGQLEPIPLALPKPLFEGTPANLKVPNLERPLGKPRPPFLAPAGTTNLALKKPVTSSTAEPTVSELEMITDGNKAGVDGTFVELGTGVPSVTIDLKQKATIYAIAVWHYHKQARVYSHVVVQVADDPDFLANLRTLFNNDRDNAAGLGIGKDLDYIETNEGKLIDAKGVVARYVHLYSDGNDTNALNHYVEVEVYGKPAQ